MTSPRNDVSGTDHSDTAPSAPEYSDIPPEIPPGLKYDHFVKGLLKRIPARYRDSFTDEQLLALKLALGARRRWGSHGLDLRGAVGFWRWRYYYVFLAGRERRTLTAAEKAVARSANAVFLLILCLFGATIAFVVLYIIKSAMGIDVFPGWHLGLWGWLTK